MTPWATLAAEGPGTLRLAADPAEVARAVGRGGLVYLATPYSMEAVASDGRWSFGASLMLQNEASIESARLAAVGVTALSPIALAAGICHVQHKGLCDGLPRLDALDRDFWMVWCRPLLRACDVMVVPELSGWNRSLGILHEAREVLGRNGRVFLYAREIG